VKKTDFALMKHNVEQWARVHANEDFMYGSPQSWWAKARGANIINDDQYEEAKTYYGTLWTYRGD